MFANSMAFDIVLKATVVLAAAMAVTEVLRRASAAARYFGWACGLAAVALLPLLAVTLPGWGVRVQTAAASPVAREVALADQAPVAIPMHATARHAWLLWIWMAGMLAALARLAAGHLQLRRLLRGAERIGSEGGIGLWRSCKTDVPLTCGLFRQAVILPNVWDYWDDDRRRVVLLHELTHARRKDPLVWFMAQVAGAMYWFHPLAWLAVARLRREQERSCDDAVVRGGATCSDYARHLVELARSMAPAGTHAAVLGMAMTSDLEIRVRALVESGRNRAGLQRGVCLAGGVGVLAVLLPLAAVHAQSARQPGSLYGAVRDPSGAVVPNALVLLKNSASQQEATRANAAGEYSFSVPGGDYNLVVRAAGFAEFQKHVVLPASGAMDILLSLGAVNESMEVVGKGPALPPSGTPRRIRVGGNVQATKLVSMAKPVYPPDAQAAGTEGTVLLRAVISTTGDLLGLSVVNTSVNPELARSAMDAVSQWHYQPTLLNAAPVEVVTTITITFRLER